jgi:hypothetical protein
MRILNLYKENFKFLSLIDTKSLFIIVFIFAGKLKIPIEKQQKETK